MKYRIILKLSYYNYSYLTLLVNNLFNVLTSFFTTECIIKKVNLPIKSTILTVLRSPHVAKKSREQFKRNIFTHSLVITSNKKSIVNFIYYFLLKVLPVLNCSYNVQIITRYNINV